MFLVKMNIGGKIWVCMNNGHKCYERPKGETQNLGFPIGETQKVKYTL